MTALPESGELHLRYKPSCLHHRGCSTVQEEVATLSKNALGCPLLVYIALLNDMYSYFYWHSACWGKPFLFGFQIFEHSAPITNLRSRVIFIPL